MAKYLPAQVLEVLSVQGDYEVTPLAGNENDNYLVRTTGLAFVVKRLRSAYNTRETELEAAYRARLADAGLPVVGYVPLDGNRPVLTIDGANYVAAPYVEGSVPTYSRGIAVRVAELLARIHSVDPAGLHERDTWFREDYITHTLTSISDTYADAKRRFAERRADMPNFWHTDLPRGIVHGDLHNENIIVDAEGRIASIIDWEETAVQPLVLDVALTVRSMSFQGDVCNDTIFHAFMDTYQRTRPLTKLEKELFEPALRYSALVLSVWAHFKASQGQMDQATFEDLGDRYTFSYKAPRI